MFTWLLLLMSLQDAGFCFHAGGVCEVSPATAFSYDAIEAKGRRAAPRIQHGSEDHILDSGKRSKVQANARDIRRNYTIAAWMIRKHLDYVASFDFMCKSGDVELDDRVEKFVRKWSHKDNFDVRRKHPLRRMLRILEALSVVDGDFGLIKLASGHVQGVESDRLRDPQGTAASGGWIHGVQLDTAGAPKAYSIHKRVGSGSFAFERVIPARHFILHGKFDRYDQVRGISPFTAALNPLRDTYEGLGYALARAKISQLFAFAMKRNANDGPGTKRDDGQIDFGNSPVFLDLDPDETAEFLESKTPAQEFQQFMLRVIDIALKALDIPYSFYDESFTNFFGSRAAWMHYDRACRDKRADLLDILYELTEWRLSLAIMDGELVLPKGVTLADLGCEWVPTGMPWWDPAKEVNGDLKAIEAGFDTFQNTTKRRGGGDWYRNIERNAEARKFAGDLGIVLPGAGPDPQVVEVDNAE